MTLQSDAAGQTQAAQPAAQQLLFDPRRFYTVFRGRVDRVAIYSSNRMVSMQIKRGEWEIIERVKAHLAGQSRLGVYNHTPENTCLWAVVIFDERTGQPTARDSVFFVEQAGKIGLCEVKRERTKVKGENYQCWLFFEKPTSTKKVRYLLNLLLKKLGIAKVEVIPSEDELTTGSTGNSVFLPYFSGIDKWVTGEGETRTDLGVKQNHTIFLDNEGNPLKNPLEKVHRYTEEEIDNAILYLHEYIPLEPSPEEGIRVQDSHIRKVAEKCDAFKAMTNEIRDKRMLRPEGVTFLGTILKYFDRADYFHRLMIKTMDYDKPLYDKQLDAITGPAFPTCVAFKEAGYCPKDKLCFEKRAPFIDRFGKFEEDRNKPKEVWREPSPALWIFQSIKERMGAEEETETAVIDLDVRNYEDYLLEMHEELLKKRTAVLNSKRNFSGFDTGFTSLNQVLDGLKPDTLITIAGPTASGKTVFSSQLMEQLAHLESKNCCFVTYGEQRVSMTVKTLSRMSGVDYRKIERGLLSDEEVQKIKQANETIRQTFGKYIFIVEGNDAVGVKKLKEIIDFASPKFFIIDSLESFPFVAKQRPPDTMARVEQVMNQLKTLSRYQKIPILLLHTLPDKENADTQALDSLILNMSDVYVQLIEKTPDTGFNPKEIHLHIKKNRGGEKNIALKFAFHPLQQKFVEAK